MNDVDDFIESLDIVEGEYWSFGDSIGKINELIDQVNKLTSINENLLTIIGGLRDE